MLEIPPRKEQKSKLRANFDVLFRHRHLGGWLGVGVERDDRRRDGAGGVIGVAQNFKNVVSIAVAEMKRCEGGFQNVRGRSIDACAMVKCYQQRYLPRGQATFKF